MSRKALLGELLAVPVSRGQAEIDHQKPSSGWRQNAQNGQPSPTNSIARGSCAETSFERKQKPSMSHHQVKNLAQQKNHAPRHFCENNRTDATTVVHLSARVWLDEPFVKELQDDTCSHYLEPPLGVLMAWFHIARILHSGRCHVSSAFFFFF